MPATPESPTTPTGSAPDGSTRKAVDTYSSAADHYMAPSLAFWDRLGAATVTRLDLARGSAVLDLCCGAGGSALPAARAVGEDGSVVGIDVAEPLLEIGRRRAADEQLSQLEFRTADAGHTGLADGSYDAVICVFGVFFADDPTAFVQEMARLTRPGGTVALTSWGPGLFEPANTVFWDAVGALRPDLYKAYNPWDTLTTVDSVGELLAAAELTEIAVEFVPDSQPLIGPAAFWDVVLGSGYRGTVNALSEAEVAALREQVLEQVRAAGIDTIRTDVLFGTARVAR